MAIQPETIAVTAGSGILLDSVQVTVDAISVLREVVCLGDPATGTNYANVTAAGALQVDGSGVTQPVSLSVLPSLVAGAALIGQVEVSDGTNILFTSGHPAYIQGTVDIAASQTIAVTNSTAASLLGEMKLLDTGGTNLGSIKAASTQAATTDTSLVVQINPEQPNLTTALNVSLAANQSVNVTEWNGTALSAATAGIPDVNLKNIGNSAVSASSAQLGVSLVNVGSAVQSKTNGLFVVPGDNTNSITMKAASTQSATTDTSLVVQLNPEQPNLTTALNVSAVFPSAQAVTVSSGTLTAVTSITDAVTVSQGTASNLLCKADIVGNAGATLDQANGSAVPTNGIMVGGGSVAGATNFTVLTVKAASTAAAATDTSLVVQPLVNSHVMNTAAAGTQLVGIADGSGNVLTSTSSALDVNVQSFETDVNILGNAGATLDAALGTAPTNALGAALCPITSGGLSVLATQALSDVSVEVKSSAGQIYGYSAYNPNTVPVYLYFSNATTAVTTSTFIVIAIPPGALVVHDIANGVACSTAISIICSTALGSAAAPSTAIVTTVYYR